MGQLDLVKLVKKRNEWLIIVAEVKSSAVGAEALMAGQRSRILSAAHFLSGVFGYASLMQGLVKKDPETKDEF